MAVRNLFVAVICILALAPSRAVAQDSLPELPADLKQEVDGLLTQLGDEGYHVRIKADAELRKIILGTDTHFETLLQHLNERLQSEEDPEIVTRLERMGIRECIALLKKIRDPSTAARRDEWVVFKPDPRTLPVLVIASGYESHKIRWAAAKALGQIGGKKALDTLIGLLKDKDQYVCECAAEALGWFGDRKATMPLAEALSGSEHPQVRLKAVKSLGRLKDKRSVEALAGAVRTDKNYDVRAHAAYVLGEIGDSLAVDALATGMNGNIQDRKACILALGKIGCLSAVKALVNQFAEVDTWITKHGTKHYTSRDGRGGGVAGPYIQKDNTASNIAEVLKRMMPTSFPYDNAAADKKNLRYRFHGPLDGFGTAEARAKLRKEESKKMLSWLEDNRDRLVWDPKTRHFSLKPEEGK